jgi:hypothetical protein
MFKKEWDYWQPPPTLDELSLDAGFQQMMLAPATNALPAIAGRVDLLAKPAEGAAMEIVPGIGVGGEMRVRSSLNYDAELSIHVRGNVRIIGRKSGARLC